MCGQIAQSVEQRTENPCVAGSIPVLATLEGKEATLFLLFIYSDFHISSSKSVSNLTRYLVTVREVKDEESFASTQTIQGIFFKFLDLLLLASFDYQ